jgi:cysteine-rich repeat protein
MLRTLTPAFVLASMLCFASQASAQPFVIAYATQQGTACDLTATPPQSYQSTPSSRPILPAIDIPIGQTLNVDVCFIVWPPANSSGQVPCKNGTGTESCAEQAVLTTNGGIEITGFTPEVVGGQTFPKYDASFTATSLKIAGGNPIVGRQGGALQGLPWGTATLRGVAPGGIFELTTAGGYVDASMNRKPFASTILATTVNNCGNSILEPAIGEECDDGNQLEGDGCGRTCKIESAVELEGSVGSAPGSISLAIDGFPVLVDLIFLPGAPAEEVVSALVASAQDDPAITASALQVNDQGVIDPTMGMRFATDGSVTTDPVIIGGGGTLAVVPVPEPGQIFVLAAGMALLARLARRRRTV